MTPPFVILVDGQSGAGKSTFADQLARSPRLQPCGLLRLEWLYPGWDGLAMASTQLETILKTLRAGQPAPYRTWDWENGRFGRRRLLHPAEFVVVEGSGALTRNTRSLCDLAIWIEADASRRKVRALSRDGQAYAPHWQRWARQESRHLQQNQPRDLADLVFHT